MENKLLALIILDGWGLVDKKAGNAYLCASTPYLDSLFKSYPWTTLVAAGEDVGLPEGQMGNSEVGHLNLGAGRVVYQELTRINKALQEGSLKTNPVLQEALSSLQDRGGSLHLVGLLSDGGVHSHLEHLKGLIDAGRETGQRVFVHAILDGRDVPPKNAKKYVHEIEETFQELGVGEIATIGGRYYYMDRDQRWDRTELAYQAMVLGRGVQVDNAREAVEKGYERDESDEFIKPSIVEPEGTVKDEDLVLFFNFRADRARQLTRAFTQEDFKEFELPDRAPRPDFITMTEYDRKFSLPVLFPPPTIVNGLGEWLSKKGYRQLRLAETEKYAHVTFFFNGGQEKLYPLEERCLVPSPQVATYDLQPEMSAEEVTEKALEYLKQGDIQVYIINYANLDMVGHTGVFNSAVEAVETVDSCLSRLIPPFLDQGGLVMVTSDHGNVEKMKKNSEAHTAHTANPVPLILCGAGESKLRKGRLADVSPTILDLLGIEKPAEMTGKTLLR